MRFASNAHDGDYRKNETKIPYIYHPVMLGFYLMKYDFSENVVAAALLHDTVEDTDATLDDILLEFGPEIHDLVDACSENKENSWEDRKQHQIDAIRTVLLGVVAIKVADKLNNVSDMLEASKRGDPSFWNNFTRGEDQQRWFYNSLVSSFESRSEINSHPLFLELKEKVSLLFPENRL